MGPNTFVLVLDDVASINHVVVFLTGQVPFAEGFGGSIYFGWPSIESGGISWQLLGYITNEKPSAIFKLAKVKLSSTVVDPFSGLIANVQSSTSAQIGILVEPQTEILQKTVSQDTEASKLDSYAEFSQKMLENFFNFASSYAVNPGQIVDPAGSYVSMNVIQKWYENFQRRLQVNPNFWKNL